MARGDILRYTDIGKRAFPYTSPPYGPANHNLLMAVGGWGVLLSPCYRTAFKYWHTTLSRNIVSVFYYEARERGARAFCSRFQVEPCISIGLPYIYIPSIRYDISIVFRQNMRNISNRITPRYIGVCSTMWLKGDMIFGIYMIYTPAMRRYIGLYMVI